MNVKLYNILCIIMGLRCTWLAHFHGMEKVTGSTPVRSTKLKKYKISTVINSFKLNNTNYTTTQIIQNQ